MAFKVGGKEGDTNAEPNVVPLCDVLLVLLIIFMVVTPLVQRGVDVQLPTAMNTIDMPENPEIMLYMRRDGKMYVNADEATEDTLQLLLEDALMTASDKKLYLKADLELEYGNIVDIIDIIKESGIEIIGIIADKKAEEIR
jgi:biopolymer transport protein TolR